MWSNREIEQFSPLRPPTAPCPPSERERCEEVLGGPPLIAKIIIIIIKGSTNHDQQHCL